MTDTEGIVERPTDVIGQLEYEINRGGNSATINAMIAARDELLETRQDRTFWCTLSDEYKARAERAERERDEAVAALEPFADVAEKDIGSDESNADFFRPMNPRYAKAPAITVGDMRRAVAIRARSGQ